MSTAWPFKAQRHPLAPPPPRTGAARRSSASRSVGRTLHPLLKRSAWAGPTAPLCRLSRGPRASAALGPLVRGWWNFHHHAGGLGERTWKAGTRCMAGEDFRGAPSAPLPARLDGARRDRERPSVLPDPTSPLQKPATCGGPNPCLRDFAVSARICALVGLLRAAAAISFDWSFPVGPQATPFLRHCRGRARRREASALIAREKSVRSIGESASRGRAVGR